MLKSEKNMLQSKIFTILKPKKTPSSSTIPESNQFLIKIGILTVMEKVQSDLIKKTILDKVEQTEINIKQDFKEEFNKMKNEYDFLKNENKNLSDQISNLIGLDNLLPLLDFVRKFQLKIVQELIKDNKVPNDCSDWNSMYKHLETYNNPRQLWLIIDEKAENLGLNYDHWSTLKYITGLIYLDQRLITSNEINSYNHPNQKLTKEEAYMKIEKLKGSYYSICYEPLKSLVDLIEKNNWE